jgi:transcription antitermination factor NusG
MHNQFESYKKWYVVVVKKITYTKAQELLQRMGYSFYMPIQKQLHYWSDRKKWVNVPILRPYIFLLTSLSDRKLLHETSDFFYFLKTASGLATSSESEIEHLRMLCNHEHSVSIQPRPVQKGDRVEIISGPLSGMQGYTFQESGKQRFQMHIESLGQFACIEIESSRLRVLS